jgi:hypothetical protein
MSVVTYVDVRDAVVASLRERFPRGVRVDSHAGRFDEDEIRRLFSRAPAVLTSLMRLRMSGDEETQRGEFVTWILARATNQDKLADQGVLLLSVLVPALKTLDEDWCLGGAEDVDAQNLYSSSTGELNVALWAVTWTWNLRGSVLWDGSGGILIDDELETFAGYDATHNVGEQSAEDTVVL